MKQIWSQTEGEVREPTDRERIYFYFFSSLFDIWKSDCRILSGQERKVLYSTKSALLDEGYT